MTGGLLAIEDLRVAFHTAQGVVQAVDGVSLSVAPDETVAVVGESGSGKSVTTLSVLRLFDRGGRAAALAEAAGLLRRVGIAEPGARLRAYPHQLSGGMRQRAMIAIAIACDPRLLIADEPTTALDVTIQAQIVRLLKDIQQAGGMGLMFITHDLELVGKIADRIVVMDAGQVVEMGPAAVVLAAPRHPYTRALLACRPTRACAEDGADTIRISAIPGAPPRPGAYGSSCRFADRCTMVEAACRDAAIPLRTLGADRLARCRRAEEIA